VHALTLHQPWATLIAIGAKRIETRGWLPPNGFTGRFAIHAGKGPTTAKQMEELFIACSEPHIKAALKQALIYPDQLPHSGVVAVATLARATVMTEERIAKLRQKNPTELAFGFYEPSRVAWVLDDVFALPEKVACGGRQKLWRLDSDCESAVLDQLRVHGRV
jgi:hypothetical protein